MTTPRAVADVQDRRKIASRKVIDLDRGLAEADDTLTVWTQRYLDLAVRGVRCGEVARKIARHLERFAVWFTAGLGHDRVSAVTPREVTAWRDHLAAEGSTGRGGTSTGMAPATVNTAHQVLKVAKQARAAGIRTAVLSNSLGRTPYDPYAASDLRGNFDEVVFSTDHRIRKPDPRIFQITADKLSLRPHQCVFVDDTEDNLAAAARLGMTVVFALDEDDVARDLRQIFGLPAL